MRKEPFIVDLREYHNDYDFLMPEPSSGCGISKLSNFEDDAIAKSLAVDDFTCTLNKSFIRNPDVTFLGVVRGAMEHEANNISDGDLVFVDRIMKPVSGSIAVYLCDGKYVLRCLAVEWDPDIWGIVVYVVNGI